MMDIRNTYLSTINDAYKVALSVVTNDSAIARITAAKESILTRIQSDAFVKVPFVGDFSAGKSSLINAFLGRQELLPTDITPETAVSYELWYAEDEMLELWKNNSLSGTYKIEDIKELHVSPGDIVKVYLKSEKIKDLNQRGIVLVDMPGVDSGIEAHTSAILNYIHQGTYFIIIVDVEQGTLRGTTLSFIEELKKYGISASVFLSKCDKKPTAEVQKIKEAVNSVASRMIAEDTLVGITSAHKGQFNDLESFLSSLEAESMIRQKYDSSVKKFIASITDEIELRKSLLKNADRDYSEEIELVKEKKDNAIKELRAHSNNAQSIEGSASDIMNDLEYALKAASSKLALLLYGNKDNSIDVNAEIMSIIRPVLINSFQRELSEYQDILDDGIQNFSINIDDIFLSIEDENERLGGFGDLIKDILSEALVLFEIPPVVAELIANKIAKYVPDFLRSAFGKSEAQVLGEIKTKLQNEVFPQLISSIRPKVVEILKKERESLLAKAEEDIRNESEKYDEAISQIQKEREQAEIDFAAAAKELDGAIEQLSGLLKL